MVVQIRRKGVAIVFIPAAVIFFYLLFKAGLKTQRYGDLQNSEPKPSPDPPPQRHHPLYKPDVGPSIPIVDNFPLAAAAKNPEDLPPIPSWNKSPYPHVPESTMLFIGFTRNWRLLQQTVVSYITAGWPPEDIYVVENTGTVDSNKRGLLSLQNPFYLDYQRLTKVFKVNVLSTPTLLSFSQLQNFFLFTAIERGLGYYFWSHMDVVAVSPEDYGPEYKSLYLRSVDILRQTLDPGYAHHDKWGDGRWALRHFAYDHLDLVNATAFAEVGGWDTMIPYYMTDCDMYERLFMAGMLQEKADAGFIFDVADSVEDLMVFYRRKSNTTSPTSRLMKRNPRLLVEDERGSPGWEKLHKELDDLVVKKHAPNDKGRNHWQSRQSGGKGEPFYRDPLGFEQSVQMTIEFGRKVFAEKWGHRDCNIVESGLGPEDAWRVNHDWD
ncbi:MAG: hypothetical protein M1829_006470 [Trizodia sp. TS-e1964]|nr:MAG: hypothetical protein M1829_006470 [Trizodia sp. TS-e1964]